MSTSEKIGLEAVMEMAGFMRGASTYKREVGAMSKLTSTTAGVMNRLGGIITSAFQTAAKIALTAGTAIAGAVGTISAVSVNTAIEVESAFAGLSKTVDGLTDDEGNLTEAGEAIKRQFRDLTYEIPLTTEELLGFGEVLGQLGVAEENIVATTRVIAMLNDTTNILGEEGAIMISQFMNVLGTAPEDVENLGSTIVDLGNSFATTENDVLRFGQRIAGAAAIAGLSEDEVLAISAAFSSVGVQAEAGGTAVQKVLFAMGDAARQNTSGVVDNTEEIAKARQKWEELEEKLYLAQLRMSEYTDKTKASTKETQRLKIESLTEQLIAQEASIDSLVASHGQLTGAQGALKTFADVSGVTAERFVELFKTDASEAFRLFVDGLGKADDAKGILEDLELADSRLVRSFISLSKASGVTDTSISLLAETLGVAESAWTQNTALVEEAQKRYQTFKAQMQLVKNIIRDMGLSIGDALLPFLKDFLEFAKPIIVEWAQRLPALLEQHLIPKIQSLIEFGQLLISEFSKGFARGGFLTGIGEMLDNFLEEDTIMARVWDFIEFLQNDLPAAMSTAATWVQTTLIPAIRELATWVQDTAIPAIKEIWSWLQEKWPEAMTVVSDFWSSTLQPAIENVQAAFQNILDFWTEYGPGIQETATNVFAAFQETARTLAEEIIPFLSEKLLLLSEWYSENGPLIQDFIAKWAERWTAFAGILTEAWDVIKPIINGLFDLILEGSEIVMAVATGNWSSLWESMGAVLWTVVNNIQVAIIELFDLITKALGGESWDAVKEQWSANWDMFMIILDDWWSGVQEWWSTFWEGLTGDFETGGETLGELWQNMVDGFNQAAENFGESIRQVWQNIVDGVEDFIEGAKTAGGDLMDGFTSGIKAKAQSLIDSVTGTIADAIAAAKRLLGIGSPSRLFAEIGAQTMQGYQVGVAAMQPEVNAQLMTAVAPPVVTSPVTQVTNTRSVTVNMGGQTINNGMDVGQLRSFILETVASGVGV